MKLREGTAELGLRPEDLRLREGRRREERICKNCRGGEVENVGHLVMRCTVQMWKRRGRSWRN